MRSQELLRLVSSRSNFNTLLRGSLIFGLFYFITFNNSYSIDDHTLLRQLYCPYFFFNESLFFLLIVVTRLESRRSKKINNYVNASSFRFNKSIFFIFFSIKVRDKRMNEKSVIFLLPLISVQ